MYLTVGTGMTFRAAPGICSAAGTAWSAAAIPYVIRWLARWRRCSIAQRSASCRLANGRTPARRDVLHICCIRQEATKTPARTSAQASRPAPFSRCSLCRTYRLFVISTWSRSSFHRHGAVLGGLDDDIRAFFGSRDRVSCRSPAFAAALSACRSSLPRTTALCLSVTILRVSTGFVCSSPTFSAAAATRRRGIEHRGNAER